MFSVTIRDKEFIERLITMPASIRRVLIQRVTSLALEMEGRVKSEKLSGQVLNVVSGALRRSIAESVESSDTKVIGKVYSSGDVKYAAIHEYGGTIPAHDVEATKAQALHFVFGGKEAFYKRVHIPTVQMPEKSFLRSTLAEMRDEIRDELKDAVIEGMAK